MKGKPWRGILYPFGCRVDYLSRPASREKFEARGRKGVVTGYGPHGSVEVLDVQKFVEERKTVFLVTRDFQAMEDEFPIAELQDAGENPRVWRLRPEVDATPVAEFDTDDPGEVYCRYCNKIISDAPITCAVCVSIRDTGRGRHNCKLKTPPVECARSRCEGHEGEEGLYFKFGSGAPNEQSVDLESNDEASEDDRLSSGRSRRNVKAAPEERSTIFRRQISAIERRLAGLETQAQGLGIDLFGNSEDCDQEGVVCMDVSAEAVVEPSADVAMDDVTNEGPGVDASDAVGSAVPVFAPLPQLGKAVLDKGSHDAAPSASSRRRNARGDSNFFTTLRRILHSTSQASSGADLTY